MNMQKLLQQAQDMQERMNREMSSLETVSSVGGGCIKAKVDGHKKLISIEIDPEIIDFEDLSILEDLVVSAVNQASAKMDDMLREKLGQHAATMPGLF